MSSFILFDTRATWKMPFFVYTARILPFFPIQNIIFLRSADTTHTHKGSAPTPRLPLRHCVVLHTAFSALRRIAVPSLPALTLIQFIPAVFRVPTASNFPNNCRSSFRFRCIRSWVDPTQARTPRRKKMRTRKFFFACEKLTPALGSRPQKARRLLKGLCICTASGGFECLI